MEFIKCNLCGSSDTKEYYTLPDYLLQRFEIQTTLVKCQQCGLVYQNPRFTPDEMLDHYPAEYDSYNSDNKRTVKKSWLLSRAIDYGVRKRCQFVIQYKKSGDLLDVGCATGIFLNGMQQYPGWEVQGVEISSYAAEVATSQYGLNVFRGTLEQARYPDQSFDVVTLWDVLEHLHDPVASLGEIHRILKHQGLLVLRVPNLDSLDAHFFGRCWAGLDAPRHLYVFSRHTLIKTLDLAGFASKKISTYYGSYPKFVLSTGFWLVDRGVAPSKRRIIIKILNHPMAKLASTPLFFFSGRLFQGPYMTLAALKK